MDKDHKEHLKTILDYFEKAVTVKYEKGVKEHGGHLWLKSGLIDEAINEAVDMIVYLVTLKQQLEDSEEF